MKLEEAHPICILPSRGVPGSYFTYDKKLYCLIQVRSTVSLVQHEPNVWRDDRACISSDSCVWFVVTKWFDQMIPRLSYQAAVWAQDGYSGMSFAEFVNTTLGLPSA